MRKLTADSDTEDTETMPRPPRVVEIAPEDLVRAVENGEPMQVLDVRAPARLAAGRIDILPDGRFHNIVGSRLATVTSPDALPLDHSAPVCVVCGHGNSSKPAALHLAQLGFAARSLRGGMAAWMLLSVPRDVEPTPSLDRLVQFDRVGKGALGYLLVSDGEALIVDPPRQADAYLAAAKEAHATVVGVADTHCHADYLSGGPALAERLGVPYYLNPADAVYPYDGTPGRIAFEPVEDGTVLRVGRAAVRAVATPGHTEGSVTYVVDDRAAFTGDFVFVASVGRPDLAGKTEAWAEQLWRSLETARRSWPPELIIYPGHYASDAERRPDRVVAVGFGALTERNEAFAIPDHERFRAWVLERTGGFPEAYRTIKAVNIGLTAADDVLAEELEMGRNECALSGG